jgi:predicted MFS family arabinose efflux permease
MALPAARLVLFAAVGTLDEMITNWRFFFGIAAVPGLACAILLMYQARRRSGSVPPKGATKRYDEGFRALIRIRSLYPVFAFALLWQLLYFVLATFLPSYDLVQRGLPVASTSLLFILNSLAMIFCGLLAGLLYDRFGFLLPMLGYSALAAAASFVMPHVAPMVPLAAVYVAWGLFGSPLAAGAVVGAHIAKIVPGHLRGIALGTGNMIAFLGASAGPVIFGWVIDKSGYGLFFVLVGSLYLVAALLSVAVGAKGRRRPRRAALH